MNAAARAQREGQHDKAQDLLWEAVKLAEESRTPNLMIEALQRLEAIILHTGDEARVLNFYREWLSYQPENTYALHQLAKQYARSGECSATAREIYRRALRYYPDDLAVLTALGDCLIEAGDESPEAIAVIEKAVEVDKLWLKGVRTLLNFYRSTGQLKRELEMLRRLYILNALSREEVERLARLLAIEGHTDTDSFAVYVQALKDNPGLAEPVRLLAQSIIPMKSVPKERYELLQNAYNHGVAEDVVEHALVKGALRLGIHSRAIIEMSERVASRQDDPEILEFAAINLPALRSITRDAQKIYLRYLQKNTKNKEWLRSVAEVFIHADLYNDLAVEVIKRAAALGVSIAPEGLKKTAVILAEKNDRSQEALAIYQEAYRLGVRNEALSQILMDYLLKKEDAPATLLETVLEDVFTNAKENALRLKAGQEILKRYIRKGEIVPFADEVLAFLHEQDKLENPHVDEWKMLAHKYLRDRRSDAPAIAAFRSYLKMNPQDAQTRSALLPVLLQNPSDPFSREQLRRYYRDGGKDPEVIEALLLQEAGSESPEADLLFPLVVDAIPLKISTIKSLPPAILVGAAEYAIQRGRFPEALECLEQVKKSRMSDDAEYLLTKALILNRFPEKGIQQAESIKKGRPGLNYWKGVACLHLGEYDQAESYLKKAAKESRSERYAMIRLADLFFQKGDLAHARDLYQAAASQPETAGYALVQLGVIALQFGELSRARDAFTEAIQAGESQAAKGLAMVDFLNALHWFKNDEWGRGAEMAANALKNDHFNKGLWRFAVESAFRAGVRAFAEERYETAIKFLSLALDLNYRLAEARFFLALAYHHLRNLDLSIRHFEEVLRTEYGRKARSRYYAALAMFDAGRLACIPYFLELARGDAPEYKEKALKAVALSVLSLDLPEDLDIGDGIFTSFVQANFPKWVLPSFLLKLRRYNEAVELMLSLLNGNPDDPHFLYFLGLAHILNGDIAKGVSFWHRILDFPPEMVGDPAVQTHVYSRLGYYLLCESHADRARQAFQKMQNQERPIPNLSSFLTECFKEEGYQEAKRGRLREALAKWEHAFRINPHDIQLLHNIALTKTVVGEIEEAEKLWRRLLDAWRSRVAQGENTDTYEVWMSEVNNFLEALKWRGKGTVLQQVAAEEYIAFVKRASQFYWILGLEKGATPEDIERKYFRLIKTYGPERHAEEFILIEESYQHLSQPQHRERTLVYTFWGADLNAIQKRLEDYGIHIPDYLFWESGWLPFDQPFKLSVEKMEEEFHRLPSRSEVYKEFLISVTLKDWGV
ncbi:MAG: tetratricopeptide repeat protein [bacterium JZ-2024 1]